MNSKETWMLLFKNSLIILRAPQEFREPASTLANGIDLRDWIIQFCDLLKNWIQYADSQGYNDNLAGKVYLRGAMQHMIEDAEAAGFRMRLEQGDLCFYDPNNQLVAKNEVN